MKIEWPKHVFTQEDFDSALEYLDIQRKAADANLHIAVVNGDRLRGLFAPEYVLSGVEDEIAMRDEELKMLTCLQVMLEGQARE